MCQQYLKIKGEKVVEAFVSVNSARQQQLLQ